MFGGAAKFFVEARYHYVWAPKFDLPDGTTRSANSQYGQRDPVGLGKGAGTSTSKPR